MILKLIDTKDIDIKILKFQEKNETLVELMKSLIYENSRKAMNQDKYNQKYNSYTEKYEKIKNKILKLREEKQDLKVRQGKIKIFIKNLKGNDEIISEFDEKLWYSMIEQVIVNTDGIIDFKFKNQTKYSIIEHEKIN